MTQYPNGRGMGLKNLSVWVRIPFVSPVSYRRLSPPVNTTGLLVPLAQWLEQLAHNQSAVGSNPTGRTKLREGRPMNELEESFDWDKEFPIMRMNGVTNNSVSVSVYDKYCKFVETLSFPMLTASRTMPYHAPNIKERVEERLQAAIRYHYEHDYDGFYIMTDKPYCHPSLSFSVNMFLEKKEEMEPEEPKTYFVQATGGYLPQKVEAFSKEDAVKCFANKFVEESKRLKLEYACYEVSSLTFFNPVLDFKVSGTNE